MLAHPDALERLRAEAGVWLATPPPNIVTGKRHLAPSGDPHDYVSTAPYWWPDASKPGGLPWICRDGSVNPAFFEYDNQKFETLCQAVSRLVLYARVAGSPPHAAHAGLCLRTWFLDERTRMNPHLRYAQIVPGESGHGAGIIDTTSLIFLLDTALLLPFGEGWTESDLARLRAWVAAYLDWLRESPEGRNEERMGNNHGTWFDAQIAAFAVFSLRPEIAADQIRSRSLARIPLQIEPDGSQPAELARTLSETYCTYNLLAYACLAQIGSSLAIDLWNWKSPDGRGLLPALRWMLPYYAGKKPWTAPQDKPFDPSAAAFLIQLAWQGTGDDAWDALAFRLQKDPWDRITFSKAKLAARHLPKPGAT